MLIAGFKTRFLLELVELYGEVFGSTELQRLIARMPERHQKGFGPNAPLGSRPEFLFLDEVEELLKTLDDSVGGCKSPRFETTVIETMVRHIQRRTTRSLLESSLRDNLSRIIPLLEDCWPIRPPTITVEEVPTGLRITLAVLGYSRCTRLLAFQMLGVIKFGSRISNDYTEEEQRSTLDFFGDRARIDIHQRSSQRSIPVAEERRIEKRTSQRSLRSLRPSLSEQVESILGHRAPSIPPPAPSIPSTPSSSSVSRNAPPPPNTNRTPPSSHPPSKAASIAKLKRGVPLEGESGRPSRPEPSSPLAAPRLPTIDPPIRRPSVTPGSANPTQPSEQPPSKDRIESERVSSASSFLPPSRRGNQSR
jgi:hypothetical protein